MTGMKFEMAEVKINMNKMIDALSKIVDESKKKDSKLIKRINEDIRVRDQKTEAKIAGIEKHIDAKIEEKFTDLEVKISAVENRSEANERTYREEGTKENPRTVPIECKAVAYGFREDSQEKDVKAVVEKTIKATGMKGVEYTIDCPAIPITHAFVEFQNMKIRDRYVRSASMQKVELSGRTIKISPALKCARKISSEENWIRQICDQQKQRDCTTSYTTESREEKRYNKWTNYCQDR